MKIPEKIRAAVVDIEDEFDGCVYCMNPKRNEWEPCCGEVHFERVLVTKDEMFLASEVVGGGDAE